jgi:hypothetical protein
MNSKRGIGRIAARLGLFMALAMAFALPAATAGAAAPKTVEGAALQALGADARASGATVLAASQPLGAGAVVAVARLGGGEADATGTSSRPLAPVLRATEPAWLFYEDRAAKTLFEHGGRLVLVGVESGEARVSGLVQGPPLVDGRSPRFQLVAAGSTLPGAAPGTVDTVFPTPPWPAGTRPTPAVVPTSRRLAAERLSADRVCFVRAAGTMRGFRSFAAVNRAGAALERLAARLGVVAPGLAVAAYRRGSGTSVPGYVRDFVDGKGCREVSLYLAGGGFEQDGEAAIAVGARVSDGRVSTQAVTVSDLRGLLRSRSSVLWNLTLDAPNAGALLDAVSGEANLASAQVSGRSGDASYVVPGPGAKRRPTLMFTGSLLTGLQTALADESAVAGAVADRDGGRAQSFLAALLTRAFRQGVVADSFARLGVEPRSFLRSASGAGSSAGPAAGSPQQGAGPSGGAPTTPQRPANVAPTLAANAVKVAYQENDPATVVAPGLTAADGDSGQLVGATVRVASGYVDGDDLLEFANQAGIAGSWDAAEGVLTLKGNASAAAYQAALRTVAYENLSDDPAPGVRQIAFQVDDGEATSSIATAEVDVTVANDAPELQLAPAATSFTEEGAATPVDSALTLTDPDSAQIASATVKITSGLQTAEDRLELSSPVSGIVAAYDEPTGTLTLTGPASVADFQAALRAVVYRNESDNPSTATRTVTVQAEDMDGAATPARTRDVAVNAVNNTPTVTVTSTPLAYAENGAPKALDPSLTVADVDSAQLTGATVSVASGYLNGADRLGFVDSGSIVGSWDAGSGVLSLSGSASVADYQAALRTVTYENLSDDPAPGARSVAFKVDDGSSESAAASVQVDVTVANDNPDLQLAAAPASFTEEGAATPIDAALVLTDPDSAQIASATVKISAGLQTAEDRLELSTPVTGIVAAYDEPTGTLTLTGPASVADFQVALRAVVYRNESDDPSTATRTVTVQAEDTDGAATPARTRDISLTAVDNAPTLTTTATALAYTENDAPTALDSGLTVADVDSPNLVGATVQIGAGYVEGEDRLAYPGGGGISASWEAGSGELTLSGSASPAAYEAVLRAVAYENLSDNPPAGSRTVSVRVDDGVSESAAATRTVEVTPVNDGPDLTISAGALSYTENDAAKAIAPGATVTDPDSAQIASATVKIASGLQTAEDRLELSTPVAGIVAAFDEPTGTLTLTGPASVADFQTALQAVSYLNLSEDPVGGLRTVAFQLADADGDAGPSRTRDVTVVPVNDVPVAVDDDGGETDEATPRTVAAPGVLGNDTDADNDPLTVVSVDGQPAKVGVAVVTGKGASVTVNANGSFGYDPSGSSTLRALGEGQSDTDTFTYAAGDGTASDTATVTVKVNGLPDPPEAANDSYNGVGNTTLAVGQNGPSGQAFKQLSGSVLDNDTDPDTPHASLAVSAGTSATTGGGSVTIAADGKFTYTPPTGTTGTTDTFTYTVSDGKQNDTGTVSVPLSGRVWYVDNAAAAGGTGRSSGAFDTLAAAATASSAGDTIYVFRGDGTATGQNAGIALKANQRLLGQATDLVVGGDTLFDGTSAQRSKIGNGSGVGVTLASGSRVEGIEATASGGAAIGGGAGVAGSTIADVVAAGSSGGVALSGTSGTFALSDLAVTTSGGVGILAANAGTVQFTEAGTNSVSSTGAKALDLSGTALAGAIDSVSVPSSSTGGVALLNTTGSLAFGGVSIATSGGTGFLANNVAGLSVPEAVTANVSSTGGPAVDIRSSSSPVASFDNVSSTNSSGAGFTVDSVTGGAVSASAGTIAGAAGAAVDVNGGNGTVTYGGTVNDGSGRPAEVTGRSGGTVTVSGNIAEDDTGILVNGNTAGTTTFSGATKSISTGTANAVTLTGNTGHTVNFGGGGLALTTTSGKGFTATGGGTVTVQGTGNTALSTTGTAVEVQNTTIGAADLTFRSVSANGGANGIFLNTTGASGGLVVTGNGTADSGGVIQNTVGADGSNAGVGAYLNSTSDVSLSRMRFTTHQGHAIRGSSIGNFSLTNSTINGTNGTNDANDEGSILLNGLTGTGTIAETSVQGGYEDNIDIYTTSGTLNLTIAKLTVGANSTNLGGNGVFLKVGGTSNVTTTVTESEFTSSREDLFQHNVQDKGVSNFTFTKNKLSNNHPAYLGGSGLLIALGGIEDSDVTYRIAENSVRDTGGGIFVVKGTGIGDARGRIANNNIGVVGVPGSGAKVGSGITVEARGQGSHVTAIANNTIRNHSQNGIGVIAGEQGPFDTGVVSFDVTATNNTVAEPGPNVGAGIRVETADPEAKVTYCTDLQGNELKGAASIGTDLRIRNPFGVAVWRLPGYAGGPQDEAALESYFVGRNSVNTKLVIVPGSGNGYTSTGACAQPPA